MAVSFQSGGGRLTVLKTEQPPVAQGHRRNAVLWAALLIAGLGWGGWVLSHSQDPSGATDWNAWANGTAGVALNKSLRLPWQAQLQTGNAAVRYRALGDVGAQVALGCPQWMFYRDGLRPQPGVGAEPFEARKKLLRHWVEQIRGAGVQVLMVAVPDKSRIEAEHLCGLQVLPVMRQRLDQWQQWLTQEDVPFVDLRPALEGQPQDMFFRTDVHMNAQGAAASAGAIARAALPLLGGAKGGQSFDKTALPGPQKLEGDLLALAGLRDADTGWRPSRDTVHPEEIKPVRNGGLLDEALPVEVLLAGSSNGLRSNFTPQLGLDLGREVWNLSMDGGQFSGAVVKALQQRSSWPKSLKLVIWEFSENTLSLPLTDDEKAALKAVESSSSSAGV